MDDTNVTQPASDAGSPTSGAAAPPTAPGPTQPVAGAPAAATGGAAVGTTAQPAAPNSPAQAESATKSGGDGHSNFGAKVLSSVLSGLGGTNEVQYQRQKDGTMVAIGQKSGPGQQWKRILAGGLTGAAAAAGEKPGPGAIGRGVAAGVQAGSQMAHNRDEAAREHANEDYDAQQKQIVQKAQLAKLNQDVSIGAFDLGRKKVTAQFDDAARENDLMKSIQSGGQGSTDLGTFKSFDDVLAMHKDMPNLAKEQANGNVIGIPHVNAQGVFEGMHYALVTPEWKSAKLQNDETFYHLAPPAKAGQKPTVEQQTVKAGTMSNGALWAARLASEKEITSWYGEQSKEAEATKRTGMEEAGANQRAQQHEAGEDRRAQAANENRLAVAGGKVSRTEIREHDKNYVQPAEQAEKSYQMMQHAYDEYNAAKKNGQELPTGAQSMLALSSHLATTFGQVKGSRVTKDMIQEHLGARSVSDSAKVAIQKLTNGDRLSPDQWDAFHDLIGESRRLSWETAAKQAKRKNIPVDFLPNDLQSLGGDSAAGAAKDEGADPFAKFGGKKLK